MEKWIDVIITGNAHPDFENIMDKLMASYDAAQVYEIGAPGEGINPQITDWAFRHRYPLVLGLPEDADAVLRRFGYADNRAVVLFGGGAAGCREKADAAKLLAVIADAQYREIRSTE